MPKKLKVNNCLKCGHYMKHPTKQEILCNHPDLATSKVIGTPLMIKNNNIIPKWCPLEDW